MALADLYSEALALVWFFQLRTMILYWEAEIWAEVAAWADDWILRLDEPPQELLDLSLSARRPNEAVTHLCQLAHRGDPDAALPLLVKKVLDAIEAGELSKRHLPRNLEWLYLLNFRGVPDDMRLPEPPAEFSSAVHELWLLTDSEDPDWFPDLTAEVEAMLERFR